MFNPWQNNREPYPPQQQPVYPAPDYQYQPQSYPPQTTYPTQEGWPSTPAYPGGPAQVSPIQSGGPVQLTPGGFMPFEMSYVENILRLNRGKMASLYFTYENNPEWPYKVYRGRIEEAGRDHIIVTDPETGTSYLLLMVNLDYVEFDEPIEYVPLSPGPPMAQRPGPTPLPY